MCFESYLREAARVFCASALFSGGRPASERIGAALMDERVATSLSSIRSLIKTPAKRAARLKKAPRSRIVRARFGRTLVPPLNRPRVVLLRANSLFCDDD